MTNYYEEYAASKHGGMPNIVALGPSASEWIVTEVRALIARAKPGEIVTLPAYLTDAIRAEFAASVKPYINYVRKREFRTIERD
jgi:hypothetical protein